MARRIVYAEISDWHGKDSNRGSIMHVDRRVEIDWKFKFSVNKWTGEVADYKPTYLVGFPAFSLDNSAPAIVGYATIIKPSDIEWLKSATHGAYFIDGLKVEEVKHLSARVHQFVEGKNGKSGAYIEIFTGYDAQSFLAGTAVKNPSLTVREKWLVSLVAVLCLAWLVQT